MMIRRVDAGQGRKLLWMLEGSMAVLASKTNCDLFSEEPQIEIRRSFIQNGQVAEEERAEIRRGSDFR